MRRAALLCLLLPSITWGQEYAKIISHNTVYTIYGQTDATLEEVYRIRINSDKGQRFAMFQDYKDQFRKIGDVSLTVFDPQGKKVKRLGKFDGHEFGFNPSYEISDAKIFVIRADYQVYPYEVEIKSTISLAGYINLDPWIPRGRFNLAVDKSSLKLVRPADLHFNVKEEFVNGKTTAGQEETTIEWEVTNLPAVERKVRYQDFYESEPKVLITPRTFTLGKSNGSSANWANFGDWFLDLNSDPYELDPKTMQLINDEDKADTRHLIRKLYQYMQDRTRYVSIQLGIGGFKSLPTADVEKYGYGDCKALSTYMKNMLEYAGVKSNYILVRAGNDVADVESDFVSNQFNHVYIGVPLTADTVYLECTSQISPSDFTGTFTDDRNVLWIERNKSKIIRSRIYHHSNNVRKSEMKIKLSPEGDANIVSNQNSQGVFFDEIMIYKYAPESYVKEHNQGKFSYNDYAIKSFTYNQPERNLPEFNSTFTLEVKALGRLAGTRLVFPLMPALSLKKFVDGDDLMKYYSIKRGFTLEDEIVVDVPENFWIYSLPEKENIKSRFGSYALEVDFDGSKLRIKRKVVMYKGDYTQAAFDEFKTFFQQLERIESKKLVFNSKT